MLWAPFATRFSEPRAFRSSVKTRPRQCGAVVSSHCRIEVLFFTPTHETGTQGWIRKIALYSEKRHLISQVMWFSSYGPWKKRFSTEQPSTAAGSQYKAPESSGTEFSRVAPKDVRNLKVTVILFGTRWRKYDGVQLGMQIQLWNTFAFLGTLAQVIKVKQLLMNLMAQDTLCSATTKNFGHRIH